MAGDFSRICWVCSPLFGEDETILTARPGKKHVAEKGIRLEDYFPFEMAPF